MKGLFTESTYHAQSHSPRAIESHSHKPMSQNNREQAFRQISSNFPQADGVSASGESTCTTNSSPHCRLCRVPLLHTSSTELTLLSFPSKLHFASSRWPQTHLQRRICPILRRTHSPLLDTPIVRSLRFSRSIRRCHESSRGRNHLGATSDFEVSPARSEGASLYVAPSFVYTPIGRSIDCGNRRRMQETQDTLRGQAW